MSAPLYSPLLQNHALIAGDFNQTLRSKIEDYGKYYVQFEVLTIYYEIIRRRNETIK